MQIRCEEYAKDLWLRGLTSTLVFNRDLEVEIIVFRHNRSNFDSDICVRCVMCQFPQ